MESTLTFPCSRSDPIFSRQGAALAHLDFLSLHDVVLWTDGSVPFPFGKGSSGVLANCSLCGTETTLSFSAGPVCSSFSAEACAILHAFCCSWQHQQVCHFFSLLLSDSRCNGHSLLLSSYFSRIGRIENPSWNACGHPSQDTFRFILRCPATDSLRRLLFGDRLFLYDLWSRPWGVARLVGLHGLPPCPHSSEGVG